MTTNLPEREVELLITKRVGSIIYFEAPFGLVEKAKLSELGYLKRCKGYKWELNISGLYDTAKVLRYLDSVANDTAVMPEPDPPSSFLVEQEDGSVIEVTVQ